MESRRGVSVLVSAVIYTAIIVGGIALVLAAGLPVIENMRDSAAVDQAQNFLSELDGVIQEVAAEGEGSARTVSLSFSRGEYVVDAEENEIRYELTTGADIIDPHSTQQVGNLLLTSEADAELFETSVDGTGCYMMESEYVQACIRNISEDNPESLNVSDLLVYLHNKDIDTNWTAPTTPTGNLSVTVAGDSDTDSGSIWTEPVRTGRHLGIAEVVAHVEVDSGSLSGLNYRIRYRLWSGADFLSLQVEPDN